MRSHRGGVRRSGRGASVIGQIMRAGAAACRRTPPLHAGFTQAAEHAHAPRRACAPRTFERRHSMKSQRIALFAVAAAAAYGLSAALVAEEPTTEAPSSPAGASQVDPGLQPYAPVTDANEAAKITGTVSAVGSDTMNNIMGK